MNWARDEIYLIELINKNSVYEIYVEGVIKKR